MRRKLWYSSGITNEELRRTVAACDFFVPRHMFVFANGVANASSKSVFLGYVNHMPYLVGSCHAFNVLGIPVGCGGGGVGGFA